MVTVLIADDDPNTRYLLEIFCRGRDDLKLEFAENGQEALDRLAKGGVQVLVTDIRMPVMTGDELLEAVKKQFPGVPVLIMTSYGSIEDAVEFVRRGADDYLTKPITKQVFMHRLDRVVEGVKLADQVRELRATMAQGAQIIGKSPSMIELRQRLPTVAQTEASVVIYGESGTGKEVVARVLHALSKRANAPFVAVNCGSLPEALLESELFGYKKGAFTDARSDTPGLVDAADSGTLFLDEIGEIALSVQVKLLRFLQLKEYKPLGSPKSKIADVRIIAATNRDLRRAVAEGTFREDLFYRLNIVPLTLPPLRDRPGDVSLLARHFLERFNRQFGKQVEFFTPEVFRKLEAYNWPGNVRELENKIEQLAVMSDGRIRSEDVKFSETRATRSDPRELGSYQDEKRRLLDRFEVEYLTTLLEVSEGHLSDAAERAGLDRKNLWILMKRHGFEARTFKAQKRPKKRTEARARTTD